jgi:hypothetical protein
MTAFDRKTGAYKPAAMEHVRLGGWVELTVGGWTGDSECVVFGYAVRISGDRIIIQIADEVFSPEKTGLRGGQLIEVDLEDITTRDGQRYSARSVSDGSRQYHPGATPAYSGWERLERDWNSGVLDSVA